MLQNLQRMLKDLSHTVIKALTMTLSSCQLLLLSKIEMICLLSCALPPAAAALLAAASSG
jgi:hypothetical protein